MTYLMVNLNDPADCREAIQRLRNALQRAECGPAKSHQQDGEREHDGPQRPEREGQRPSRSRRRSELRSGPSLEDLQDLPLPKKLHRIAQRGVFRHLNRIASEVETPMSLPELDRHLGFAPNKMRSLKAIMAKLENRFGLRFLVADPEGGLDENGNPRYTMPPRMRNQIRIVAAKIATP